MSTEKKKIQIDPHIKALLGMMAFVLILMAILKGDTYFTIPNLRSMFFQFPEYGILTFGMMMCMIAGGIDLSLVGIMNLAGVVCALIIKNMGGSTGSIVIGIIAALVVGAACGAFNGFIIGSLNIPAMLVTLCGLELYSGLALAITGGPAINSLPDAFKNIANGSIGAIPIVIFIFIAVVLIITFIMKCTVFGHEIYYLGTNAQASKYSGINNLKVTIMTYMCSGILGGIAGVVITSHLNSAKSSNGSSYTTLSLLIAVLGGINPDGGEGKVGGVLLSIVLLQLVANAFTIMRAPDTTRTLVNGCLLVLALIIDKVTVTRRARRS
ncbi:ABC transporter permease [Blautia sp. MSJ-9]|uniref:ABC transporter permease n=1 Tax=Blautia sp. MSJ-9 TaxID=2841511 RepID=UPI001C10964D|nr:ABC transporter permease [Blautia sp. MSJ-9]MBU5681090.1 ABC transporter permease [Blautia sp. MSJ-9]